MLRRKPSGTAQIAKLWHPATSGGRKSHHL